MNASTSLMTYDWISKRRFWLSCAVSPVLLAVGCVFLFMAHPGWRLAGGAVIVLGLLMLIQKRTILDKPQSVLHVAHHFLRFCPIWRRTFRLEQFDAVVIERRTSYHRAQSESYDIHYRVGLRRKTGRLYWVRDDSFVNGQPCRRAEEFAHRLSCDTGLEIIEIEV